VTEQRVNRRRPLASGATHRPTPQLDLGQPSTNAHQEEARDERVPPDWFPTSVPTRSSRRPGSRFPPISCVSPARGSERHRTIG
jgi:hypothetical protein